MIKLMEKSKKSSFLEWNNSILISSIKKINFNIILIIILDAFFYIFSGYFFIFWLQRIQAKMATFQVPADIISLGYERAQQVVSDVKAFYYLIIFSFILLLIAIIFLASILKGIIWAKTTNTKISLALLSKFLGLNLIWMGFWFVLIILISLFAEPVSAPLLMVITILLGLYLTNTLYALFMKQQSFKSIIHAVKLSFMKIHLFLLPYTIILLLFFIIARLGNLLKFSYSTALLSLIIIAYIAVVRHYASTLVGDIDKL